MLLWFKIIFFPAFRFSCESNLLEFSIHQEKVKFLSRKYHLVGNLKFSKLKDEVPSCGSEYLIVAIYKDDLRVRAEVHNDSCFVPGQLWARNMLAYLHYKYWCSVEVKINISFANRLIPNVTPKYSLHSTQMLNSCFDLEIFVLFKFSMNITSWWFDWSIRFGWAWY